MITSVTSLGEFTLDSKQNYDKLFKTFSVWAGYMGLTLLIHRPWKYTIGIRDEEGGKTNLI